MKKLTSLIIILALLTGCAKVSAYTVSYNGNDYTYNDLDTIKANMEQEQFNMDAAHIMAEAGRSLGYLENHDVIELAKQEYEEAYALYSEYEVIYNDLIEHWKVKEEEYPDAAFIWNYLKNLEYNDYVCAGIIGNIMVECGGSTLNLRPLVYSPSKSFYGICQWNEAYPDVRGVSLEEQCDFLRDTIEYEFNTYGNNYKKDFNYKEFLKLEDSEKAALAFAKVYERCSSSSYKERKQCATIAYNYFIS